MASPGPVLLKRYTRSSKFDPPVEEVELLEANLQYSRVRFANGHEDTITNKHLAPRGEAEDSAEQEQLPDENSKDNEPANIDQDETETSTNVEETSPVPVDQPTLRRSTRTRRRPERLTYY